jgi:hypothetical protein
MRSVELRSRTRAHHGLLSDILLRNVLLILSHIMMLRAMPSSSLLSQTELTICDRSSIEIQINVFLLDWLLLYLLLIL